MSGAPDSAFNRALGLVTFASGVLASYAALPHAYGATEAWVKRHTLNAYGPENLDLLLIAWQVILALLIYAVVRGILHATLSLIGLGLALLVVRRRGRD